MNRSALIVSFLALGALTTWIGWRTGYGQPQAGSPVARETQSAGALTSAPVTGSYPSMADAQIDVRMGRPLSAILQDVERLRYSPSLETQGELLAVLGSLEADEIAPVLDFLKSLPPPVPAVLLGTVLNRWASFDAPAAMAWTKQLSPVRREEVRGGILAVWAAKDGRAAWEWYRTEWAAAPEPRYRLEQDFPALIHAWAKQDTTAALEACLAEEKHGTYDVWWGLTSLVLLPEHREELLRLVAGIPEEKKRAAAVRSTLSQWARHEPATAAAWLDRHTTDRLDTNLIWAVSESFARSDPRANADWLLARTPPEKRDEIMVYAISSWSRAEPEAAGAWLESAGITDSGAQLMVHAWADKDLERAIGWARRASPAQRPQAVASALAAAKKGDTPPDFSRYAEVAGVSAEELQKQVEQLKRQWSSRL